MLCPFFFCVWGCWGQDDGLSIKPGCSGLNLYNPLCLLQRYAHVLPQYLQMEPYLRTCHQLGPRGWALNPMPVVLLRGGENTRRHIGEVTEAETGVTRPSAKSSEDCQQPARARREAWDRLFLSPSRKNQPYQRFDFGLLASGPKSKVWLFEATQNVAAGLRDPGK